MTKKDYVESAISKHQADIVLPPDNSTNLSTVIQLSVLISKDVLIAQELFLTHCL